MFNKYNDNTSVRVNYLDNDCIQVLSDYISKHLKPKTLFVCIGTDKCIGDCLGPLVGTNLINNNIPFPILGNLEFPAHAINIDNVIKNISAEYSDYFIIAIDACLGYDDCVGDIHVKMGPIHPGKGVGKTLPHIGNISIVGVVDTIDNSDLFSIKNIRLNFIMKMASIIAEAITSASKNYSPVDL